MSLNFYKAGLSFCLTLTLTISVSICSANDDVPKQVVKDLDYGESLFYFYQEDYFDSLTTLLVSQIKNPTSKQGYDPLILTGGLYLSYGLYNRAFEIFTNLINKDLPLPVQDRAWFYLGKLYYLKGYYDNAEQALLKIRNTLPEHRKDERLNILANIYIKNKRYNDAIALLANFSSDSIWEFYARYNLGVALIKAQQVEAGIKQMDEVTSLDPVDPETRALRDKSNLAVGYAYLRDNKAQNAAKYLENVRLEGPLSNKALLGIGWAHAAKNEHTRALVPWLELKSRNPHDIAVQESLLAIPFTFEKLNADDNALEFYQYAVNEYEKEINSLQTIMTDVDTGELIRALHQAYNRHDGRKRAIDTPPDSHITPYIESIISKNEFQQAYLNYRDLLHLQKVLENWLIQFPAYELMLAERKKRYDDKYPTIASDDRLNLIEQFKLQRDKFSLKINEIEKSDDPRGLATDKEIELLNRLQRVIIQSRQSSGEDLSVQRHKTHILNGLLFWEMSRNYIPRLWQVKNTLYTLDKAILDAERAQINLKKSLTHSPTRFVGFSDRINQNRQKILRLKSTLKTLTNEQEQFIVTLSLRELNTRQRLLRTYHSRARYSLARLSDKIATRKKSGQADEK